MNCRFIDVPEFFKLGNSAFAKCPPSPKGITSWEGAMGDE